MATMVIGKRHTKNGFTMKGTLGLLIPVIICLLLFLGCVSKATYDETQASLQAAENHIADLDSKLNDSQNKLRSKTDSLVAAESDAKVRDFLLLSTKGELETAKAQNSSLDSQLVRTKSELEGTKRTLATAESRLGSAESKLKLYKDTLGIDISSGVQPQAYRIPDRPESGMPKLVANDSASNPSWQRLKAFLDTDSTSGQTYIEDRFMCVGFAEMLQNHAATVGIRAAMVFVQFKGSEIGHALNAFVTTDKGIVYIDATGPDYPGMSIVATGRGSRPEANWTKVAYVARGKDYGAVSLSDNTPLDYYGYVWIRTEWERYNRRVKAFNSETSALSSEIDRFNKEIKGKTYYIGTAAHKRISQWKQTLEDRSRAFDEESADLDRLRNTLKTTWNPLGIVSEIEIYW